MKRFFYNPKVYIILLLAFTAVVLLIRAQHHEYVADEVSYHYKFTEEHHNIMDYYLNPRIATLGDVIDSQITHYKYINGRTLIHIVEQAFSGVYNTDLFKAINIILFVILTYSLMLLCVPSRNRKNIMLWLINVLVLMYLFPETYQVWTSINITPNYLYPTLLYTVIFILWQRIRSGKDINRRWLPIIAIGAFIAGWSHEGFSVPVSGAMVVYYLCNFKQLRGSILWVVIPVWIGSLLVIGSPGLLHRAVVFQDITMKERIVGFFIFMRGLQVVRLYVVVMCIYAIIKPRKAIRRMYNDRIYLYILFFATIVVFIAHTGFRSMMIGDLVCFIMLFKWIAAGVIWEHNTRNQCVIASLISILYVSHQILIVRDVSTQYYHIRSIINELKKSECGIIKFEDIEFPSLTKNYVQDMDELSGVYLPENTKIYISIPGVRSTLQALNDCLDKPFYPLYKDDYNAVVNPDKFFIPENRISGDTRLYYGGGHCMWFEPGTPVDSMNVEIHYAPLTWREGRSNFYRLLYLISPPAHNEPLDAYVDTIETCYGTSYRVWLEGNRRIISANRK